MRTQTLINVCRPGCTILLPPLATSAVQLMSSAFLTFISTYGWSNAVFSQRAAYPPLFPIVVVCFLVSCTCTQRRLWWADNQNAGRNRAVLNHQRCYSFRRHRLVPRVSPHQKLINKISTPGTDGEYRPLRRVFSWCRPDETRRTSMPDDQRLVRVKAGVQHWAVSCRLLHVPRRHPPGGACPVL